MESVRFVGLDVHAATIAVAVAEPGGEVRSLGTIANRPEAVRKLVKKLGPAEQLRVCYEAGPCGYVLYWQCTELGVPCVVVAPTLTPVKAGDRVKTDRRDAEKLARSHRAGELTAVWVPDPAVEALRDLVRTRVAAKRDQLRARQRLAKLLLRHGRRPPTRTKAWGTAHLAWIKTVRFEHPDREAAYLDLLHEVEHAQARIPRLERAIEAAIAAAPAPVRDVIAGLQALRGVAQLTAVTLVTEIGQFTRFPHPSALMSYGGIVPREHSSGTRVWRGGITKTGNGYVRAILVEASWAYRHRPRIGYALHKRQEALPERVKEIAWTAQTRLYQRYRHLLGRGVMRQKVVTALARELLGFAWAIGVTVEQCQGLPAPAPLPV